MTTFTITNGLERSVIAEIKAHEFSIDKDSGHIVFKGEPTPRALRPGEGPSYEKPVTIETLAILVPAPGLLIQIKQNS